MSQSSFNWDQTFRELFDRCCARYRAGDEDFKSYYSEADAAFLDSIGYQPREFFDFVEDFCDEGVPSPESALLIASVRRDYLDVVQNGLKSEVRLLPDALPGRDSELGGFAWLPRILAKARAKLRGELDPNIMYSCGGDRAFLARHNIHPADFLRVVWAAGASDEKVASYVAAQQQNS